jgi:putative redox protein
MAEKSALVRQVRGMTFAGLTESGHWVTVDGPPEFGGSSAAIRPKELILISLGACTGSDVVSILQKKRVRLEGFEVRLKAQVAEEHPQVYTSMCSLATTSRLRTSSVRSISPRTSTVR